MDAKELRIGNLIRYNDTKEVCSVYQLEHRYKNVYRINGLNENPDVGPIPLTEEWLLRFGYKGSVESNFFEKDCFTSISFIKHTIWIPFKKFLDNQNGKHIEHVHQLQNLYFALTGEELVLSSEV